MKKGFTLVELLVVIAIIGVLAVALVPSVMRYLKSGADTACKNNMRILMQGIATYAMDHDQRYPTAGTVFGTFTELVNDTYVERFGQARGWVYSSHDCERAADWTEVSDGNANGRGYDPQTMRETATQGVCKCFSVDKKEGGLTFKPASWYAESADRQSDDSVLCIINGALYPYINDERAYLCEAHAAQASEKHSGIKESFVTRSYAMNVIAAADPDLFDLPNGYAYGTHGYASLTGPKVTGMRPLDSSEHAGRSIDAAKTVLIVELDCENDKITEMNGLAGDQVWDWDEHDECIGFCHESQGIALAHVAFADGHIETIKDPSMNPAKPDMKRRLAVSKWYGSGTQDDNGQLY